MKKKELKDAIEALNAVVSVEIGISKNLDARLKAVEEKFSKILKAGMVDGPDNCKRLAECERQINRLFAEINEPDASSVLARMHAHEREIAGLKGRQDNQARIQSDLVKDMRTAATPVESLIARMLAAEDAVKRFSGILAKQNTDGRLLELSNDFKRLEKFALGVSTDAAGATNKCALHEAVLRDHDEVLTQLLGSGKKPAKPKPKRPTKAKGHTGPARKK